MTFFSDCSGKCCTCYLGADDFVCLAGHGDNDYRPATAEQIKRRLDAGEYPDHKGDMVAFLAALESKNGLERMEKKVDKQEWIGVKQRLPEAGKDVLVALSRGEITVDFYSIPNGWGYSDVTHWMPLPKMPKCE